MEQAKIYTISLQKNKRIREHYQKHPIYGCTFLEQPDIKQISNADMLFILSSKDIDKKTVQEYAYLKAQKIIFAPNKVNFGTSIKTTETPAKIHWFIKLIVETISMPSLVGLDYAYLKQIFSCSKTMTMRRYTGNISEKEKLIKKIKQDSPKRKYCFLVMIGSPDLTLDDVSEIGGKLAKGYGSMVWGVKVIEKPSNFLDIGVVVGK